MLQSYGREVNDKEEDRNKEDEGNKKALLKKKGFVWFTIETLTSAR